MERGRKMAVLVATYTNSVFVWQEASRKKLGVYLGRNLLHCHPEPPEITWDAPGPCLVGRYGVRRLFGRIRAQCVNPGFLDSGEQSTKALISRYTGVNLIY